MSTKWSIDVDLLHNKYHYKGNQSIYITLPNNSLHLNVYKYNTNKNSVNKDQQRPQKISTIIVPKLYELLIDYAWCPFSTSCIMKNNCNHDNKTKSSRSTINNNNMEVCLLSKNHLLYYDASTSKQISLPINLQDNIAISATGDDNEKQELDIPKTVFWHIVYTKKPSNCILQSGLTKSMPLLSYEFSGVPNAAFPLLSSNFINASTSNKDIKISNGLTINASRVSTNFFGNDLYYLSLASTFGTTFFNNYDLFDDKESIKSDLFITLHTNGKIKINVNNFFQLDIDVSQNENDRCFIKENETVILNGYNLIVGGSINTNTNDSMILDVDLGCIFKDFLLVSIIGYINKLNCLLKYWTKVWREYLIEKKLVPFQNFLKRILAAYDGDIADALLDLYLTGMSVDPKLQDWFVNSLGNKNIKKWEKLKNEMYDFSLIVSMLISCLERVVVESDQLLGSTKSWTFPKSRMYLRGEIQELECSINNLQSAVSNLLVTLVNTIEKVRLEKLQHDAFLGWLKMWCLHMEDEDKPIIYNKKNPIELENVLKFLVSGTLSAESDSLQMAQTLHTMEKKMVPEINRIFKFSIQEKYRAMANKILNEKIKIYKLKSCQILDLYLEHGTDNNNDNCDNSKNRIFALQKLKSRPDGTYSENKSGVRITEVANGNKIPILSIEHSKILDGKFYDGKNTIVFIDKENKHLFLHDGVTPMLYSSGMKDCVRFLKVIRDDNNDKSDGVKVLVVSNNFQTVSLLG
ncbi:uncharacterized protein SCODWIG_01306 [Saccharomycodes ludwigii]|uniref:Anaphase-promoting complex subunit 4 long domain-containing protein n=1 Tax=Saccharomycodes ludwigii TaxID=36035 RepID=A0A376B4D3_9ASCO|nr:hypothetical protein SCDLUD_001706 [Saccharomycodes ludwigii]KAH3901922.1 hypothetical protein SCDLUD_001706 [Saccharomycodes ludwigii]SSD59545.1 uncharacterized protein SCODWIG_01306 [Saccharomycodes ludwigii]